MTTHASCEQIDTNNGQLASPGVIQNSKLSSESKIVTSCDDCSSSESLSASDSGQGSGDNLSKSSHEESLDVPEWCNLQPNSSSDRPLMVRMAVSPEKKLILLQSSDYMVVLAKRSKSGVIPDHQLLNKNGFLKSIRFCKSQN